jgi:hypothetical protein
MVILGFQKFQWLFQAMSQKESRWSQNFYLASTNVGGRFWQDAFTIKMHYLKLLYGLPFFRIFLGNHVFKVM